MAAVLQTTFSDEFLYANCYILIQLSLKFLPNCPINNKQALAQIIFWRQPGDRSLSGPIIIHFGIYISFEYIKYIDIYTDLYRVCIIYVSVTRTFCCLNTCVWRAIMFSQCQSWLMIRSNLSLTQGSAWPCHKPFASPLKWDFQRQG